MLCYKNLMVKNILMHFREDVRYNRITLLSIAKLDQEKPITFVDDRFFHITTQEKKNLIIHYARIMRYVKHVTQLETNPSHNLLSDF